MAAAASRTVVTSARVDGRAVSAARVTAKIVRATGASAMRRSATPGCRTGNASPTTTSILATVEPLVTVRLAFVVFGETLGTVQLAGGALVLAAVLVHRAPRPAVRMAA
jgi:hypothetical protein